MDELLSTNWGDIVGAVGLVITIVGFGIAIYQATKARKAADAAEVASQETRRVITRALTAADLQRAIALIERLKGLHRQSEWEISLQHYQPLRVMLADVNTRYPELEHTISEALREAVAQIAAIENSVDQALRVNSEPSGLASFNEVLNTIQMSLEGMASSILPGSEANR